MFQNRTLTFDKIENKRKLSVQCVDCGKKYTRVLSAYQTISPFNKNEEGELKSASEIRKSNQIELNEKERELRATFKCSKCYALADRKEKGQGE